VSNPDYLITHEYRSVITGLIHVGAEVDVVQSYIQTATQPVIFVQPDGNTANALRSATEAAPEFSVVEAACVEASGFAVVLHECTDPAFTSLLPLTPIAHARGILPTTSTLAKSITLAEVIHSANDKVNTLNIAATGYEVGILAGAGRSLGCIDFIYMRSHPEGLFDGQSTIGEIRAFMKGSGFIPLLIRVEADGSAEYLYRNGGRWSPGA
jgi:FkbM family methyltransferase